VPKTPFERVDYDDVVDLVNSKGVPLRHGEDLSRAAEKAMGEIKDGYYFITGWPTDIKPFYVIPSEEDPAKSCAFDLMYRDLEIASGAKRVHQHDLLVEKIKNRDSILTHSTGTWQHLNTGCRHTPDGDSERKGSPCASLEPKISGKPCCLPRIGVRPYPLIY